MENTDITFTLLIVFITNIGYQRYCKAANEHSEGSIHWSSVKYKSETNERWSMEENSLQRHKKTSQSLLIYYLYIKQVD